MKFEDFEEALEELVHEVGRACACMKLAELVHEIGRIWGSVRRYCT